MVPFRMPKQRFAIHLCNRTPAGAFHKVIPKSQLISEGITGAIVVQETYHHPKQHRDQQATTAKQHRDQQATTAKQHRDQQATTAKQHRDQQETTTKQHRDQQATTAKQHRYQQATTAKQHRDQQATTAKQHRDQQATTAKRQYILRNKNVIHQLITFMIHFSSLTHENCHLPISHEPPFQNRREISLFPYSRHPPLTPENLFLNPQDHG
ncbi:hypothetical protein CDAR_281231 [Caerostris darwini]|uniref:Uncharacterized protein n=1 Tax=Caerostris darwini TaxID=1538125 RepID=A0AAV4WYM2_9ARAC|nr:hypothetical protein CDAR_281231 [Caerostris darwini]